MSAGAPASAVPRAFPPRQPSMESAATIEPASGSAEPGVRRGPLERWTTGRAHGVAPVPGPRPGRLVKNPAPRTPSSQCAHTPHRRTLRPDLSTTRTAKNASLQTGSGSRRVAENPLPARPSRGCLVRNFRRFRMRIRRSRSHRHVKYQPVIKVRSNVGNSQQARSRSVPMSAAPGRDCGFGVQVPG